MKTLHKMFRIGSDERAQAMTEYVIVIPMVLFLFFAMLQTMLVAQASQLCNYAAFAAARSYATSLSKFLEETGDADQGNDKAISQAKNAALLVMGPISHAQTGEARSLWKPVRNTVKGKSQKIQQFYGIAEGYVTAMIYRMKDFTLILDGNSSSSKSVVKVDFKYLMPIAIPGFAEMWTYLQGRDKSKSLSDVFDLGAPFVNAAAMNESLKTVLDALAAVEGVVGGGTFGGVKSDIESLMNGLYGSGQLGAKYNVTLSAKSICGFEPWSGVVRTDDIEERCEGEFDESMQPCIDAAKANDSLVEKQVKECEEADKATKAWEEAVKDRQKAEQDYNSCSNPGGDFVTLPDANGNPTSVKKKCQDEWGDFQDAREVEDDAYEKMEDESEECQDAGEDVEDNLNGMKEKCKPPV